MQQNGGSYFCVHLVSLCLSLGTESIDIERYLIMIISIILIIMNLYCRIQGKVIGLQGNKVFSFGMCVVGKRMEIFASAHDVFW